MRVGSGTLNLSQQREAADSPAGDSVAGDHAVTTIAHANWRLVNEAAGGSIDLVLLRKEFQAAARPHGDLRRN